MEIKPGIGISILTFGSSMADAEKAFGKPEEIASLNEIEEYQSIVWHYWEKGFSLFFDEQKGQEFCCVEIEHPETTMWGSLIFKLKEKEIIELFKAKGIARYDSETHEWGEKRVSFDEVNIDLYFENNKLVSVNYGKIAATEPLILSN